MARRKDYEYEVGYGKPPVESRFQKGQSGNPSGRPKGRRSLASIFMAELYSTLTVEENGQVCKKSKLDLILDRLGLKAAAGDPKARALLFALHDAHYDPDMPEPPVLYLPEPPR